MPEPITEPTVIMTALVAPSSRRSSAWAIALTLPQAERGPRAQAFDRRARRARKPSIKRGDGRPRNASGMQCTWRPVIAVTPRQLGLS